MTEHDSSYHLLFSHPQLVEDLMRNFVPEAWVAQLDFGAMQRINAKFHAEGLERREGDLIYRIPYKQGPGEVYLYLLLEFQSSPDPWMAVRCLAYVSLLYQQLIKEDQLTANRKLPPVFPLVLYNGDQAWAAPLDLHSLIGLPEHSPLRRFQPQFRYYLLDESLYPKGKADSITGVLFEIENIQNLNDLRDCVQRLETLIPETQASLRRAFLVWLKYVSMPIKGLHLTPRDFEHLSEFKEMLSTRIEKWEQDKLREVREKGRKEGKAAMLVKALVLKFGPIPQDVQQQIDHAEVELIERWFEQMLAADHLNDVFK